MLPSSHLQAGFAAEGVESGTVFSDINLQEKVQDLGALWGAVGHLVGIIFLLNKARQRGDADSTLLFFLLVILVFTIAQHVMLKHYLVITCRKAGMGLLEKIHLR